MGLEPSGVGGMGVTGFALSLAVWGFVCAKATKCHEMPMDLVKSLQSETEVSTQRLKSPIQDTDIS